MRALLVLAFVLFVASCETVEFYGQAVSGQLSIEQAKKPTAELIASQNTDPALTDRLRLIAGILQFAQEELALEPGKRFSSFVHLDADSVVWNVFATPEFSTHATKWCYPIAGCASYRGYFDRLDAKRYAKRLIVQRHDTIVGGVAAYSTLGWFNDPLLSTFIQWPDTDLAGLIFHELAHARVYVSGDTSFNEAFATFVERRGVLAWLRQNHGELRAQVLMRRWQASDRFVAYLLRWRDELQHLYDQPYDPVAMRLLKNELFAEAERCYRANADEFGDQDWFFRRGLNNARLVPLAAYNELIDGFEGLFAQAEESWPKFYESVAEVGHMKPDARDGKLQQLSSQFGAGRSNKAKPIRCESLQF